MTNRITAFLACCLSEGDKRDEEDDIEQAVALFGQYVLLSTSPMPDPHCLISA